VNAGIFFLPNVTACPQRNVFLDSFDELNELGSDVRASTAAHNSARFAYDPSDH
jgi:hypothetical protein